MCACCCGLCKVPAVAEEVDIWLAHTDTRYQLSQIRESGHLACTHCNCFIDLKCMWLWIMWGTSCPRESGHLACTQWHKVLAVPEKVDTWLAHTDTQTDTQTDTLTPITTAHLQLSCIIKRATEFLVETAPKSHVAERYVWGMYKCTMYQAVTCDKHWKSSADYTAVIVRLLVATLHIHVGMTRKQDRCGYTQSRGGWSHYYMHGAAPITQYMATSTQFNPLSQQIIIITSTVNKIFKTFQGM